MEQTQINRNVLILYSQCMAGNQTKNQGVKKIVQNQLRISCSTAELRRLLVIFYHVLE